MKSIEDFKRICPIVEDDHQLISDIFLKKLAEIAPARGVIHLGAHEGQEVSLYLQAGFKKILLVEANPSLASKLKAKYIDEPRVFVASAAVSEVDGDAELLIHTSRRGSVEPASLLPMKQFDKIVQTLHTPEKIAVKSFKLDTLLPSLGLRNEEFNYLVLDIQGAELLALRGSQQTLGTMDAVLSEVQVVDLYEEGANVAALQEFLQTHDFDFFSGILHELYDERGRFPAWGEFLFVKKDLLPAAKY